MHTVVATLVFLGVIGGLFWLDRSKKSQTSTALFICLIWLSLAGSRSFGQWMGTLHGGSVTDTASDESEYTEGSPLDRLVYSGLLLTGLLVLVRRRQRVWKILRSNWPLAAFFLYCAVSVLWSDFPDVAFKRWVKALGDVVMVLIVLSEIDRYAAIKRLLAWTGFVLIPISILFIKFYPDFGRGYHPWTWTPYYTGVTTNKNELGRLCLVLGLGFVWRFLTALRMSRSRARTKQLAAFGACLGMTLWLFYMSDSMTSLSCFLLATGLMVGSTLRTVARKPWLVHVMVIAIIAASITTLFLDMGSGVLQSMGRDATLTGRTDIWKLVLGMAGNPFFGTGFESFWLGKRLEKMWSIYWWHPREAHDGYIEMYLNLGWLGIAMFGIVLVTGYRTVVSAFRRNVEEGKIRLAYFTIAVAYNFAESAFGTLNPVWILFLLATISVPGGWIKTKPRKTAPGSERISAPEIAVSRQVPA